MNTIEARKEFYRYIDHIADKYFAEWDAKIYNGFDALQEHEKEHLTYLFGFMRSGYKKEEDPLPDPYFDMCSDNENERQKGIDAVIAHEKGLLFEKIAGLVDKYLQYEFLKMQIERADED